MILINTFGNYLAKAQITSPQVKGVPHESTPKLNLGSPPQNNLTSSEGCVSCIEVISKSFVNHGSPEPQLRFMTSK